VIDQWSAVIANTVRTPGVRERLVDLGLEPTGTTPEELAAIMAADTARWAPIRQGVRVQRRLIGTASRVLARHAGADTSIRTY
jgi:tripartite-type tricarboxylate transporter receptor subunit TctC